MNGSLLHSRLLRVASQLPKGDVTRRKILSLLKKAGSEEVAIAVHVGKSPTGHDNWKLVNSSRKSDIGTVWAMSERADKRIPQLVSYYTEDQFVNAVDLGNVRT